MNWNAEQKLPGQQHPITGAMRALALAGMFGGVLVLIFGLATDLQPAVMATWVAAAMTEALVFYVLALVADCAIYCARRMADGGATVDDAIRHIGKVQDSTERIEKRTNAIRDMLVSQMTDRPQA